MLAFAFYIALSPLLIVAVPLPARDHPTEVDANPRSTLYRRAPPKFEIPAGYVIKAQRKDTLDKMMEHYNTKSTDEQQGAGLVRVASRWSRNPIGRWQKMQLTYHAGDTIDSPAIGPPAEIYREIPTPKMYFQHVSYAHQEEMKPQGLKRYNDLGDESASKVKSMKVWGTWNSNGGITQKTQLTFHSHTLQPKPGNMIGPPVTIQRPLTLRITDVPLMDRLRIETDVRAAHRQMVADEQHPASKSNFGVVDSGWHDSLPDADGKTHKQVVVRLHEVSEDEKQRTYLGLFPVRKRLSDYESPGLNTDSSTLHTGSSLSHLKNEVPHPSTSQDPLRLTLDLSTNASPSNSGSSHPNSQGMSQFHADSPSSHPGPSRSELSHPISPHRALQPHISQEQQDLTVGSPLTNASPFLVSAQSGSTDFSVGSNNEVTSFRQSRTSAFKRWHSALPPNTGPSHLNSQGPSQFDAGNPPSQPGSSHPVPSRLILQSDADNPLQHDNFNMPSPDLSRPRDPGLQPLRDTQDLMHPESMPPGS